jgi:hypothetical protein
MRWERWLLVVIACVLWTGIFVSACAHPLAVIVPHCRGACVEAATIEWNQAHDCAVIYYGQGLCEWTRQIGSGCPVCRARVPRIP